MNNRPPQPAAAHPENAERTENSESTENNQQQDQQEAENEPLINTNDNELQTSEPQVSWLTIARTFVVSFVASIIPEHPAMWSNFLMFAVIYAVTFLLVLLYKLARNSGNSFE